VAGFMTRKRATQTVVFHQEPLLKKFLKTGCVLSAICLRINLICFDKRYALEATAYKTIAIPEAILRAGQGE